jgi:hypothetical protein
LSAIDAAFFNQPMSSSYSVAPVPALIFKVEWPRDRPYYSNQDGQPKPDRDDYSHRL